VGVGLLDRIAVDLSDQSRQSDRRGSSRSRSIVRSERSAESIAIRHERSERIQKYIVRSVPCYVSPIRRAVQNRTVRVTSADPHRPTCGTDPHRPTCGTVSHVGRRCTHCAISYAQRYSLRVRMVCLCVWYACAYGMPVRMVCLCVWYACAYGMPVRMVCTGIGYGAVDCAYAVALCAEQYRQ
jgi:hypothetical protein